MKADADVIVIGAGLAGLVTAAHLEAAGRDVIVVEARGECGGRTRTDHVDGHPINLGAELVGPDHLHLKALVRDLGLTLIPTKLSRSRSAWSLAGRRKTGFLPGLGLADTLTLWRIARKVKRESRALDPLAPWSSPRASEYDGESFGAWLRTQTTSSAVYELCDALIGGFLTASIDQLSRLFVLWSVRRGGGPLRALDNGSAMWVAEGSQAIADGQARRLRRPVRLHTQVARIAQAASVHVTTTSGETLCARRVVAAVPLPVIRSMTFEPDLPPPLASLTAELDYGRGSKVHRLLGSRASAPATAIGNAAIPVAWQRERCLIGLARTHDADSTLAETLASAFGATNEPAIYSHVQRWSAEPLTGGTYLVFKPGELTRHGPHLRAAHGRIYFAGADRSSWPDNMEGAVESGIDVARRVLVSLRA
jgi:monoamine oxidase